MTKVNKGRDYVYYLHYHIVWCVKYRHKILTGNIKRDLKALLKEISKDNNIEILEKKTNKDHVHLLFGADMYGTQATLLLQ